MTSGTKVETRMNEDETTPSGEYREPAPETPEPGLTKGTWIGVAVIAVIVALVVVFGIAARHRSEGTLEEDTKAASIPSVNVIHPASSVLSSGLALPGNTQAYVDTPIYARTSGYLKNWYFDIGAHVRKG